MKIRKMRSKKRFFENHETWNNYGISKKGKSPATSYMERVINIHEMALDMEGFIYYIHMFPNLVVICGLEQILDEMELTFVTYVSILIFTSTVSVKKPMYTSVIFSPWK